MLSNSHGSASARGPLTPHEVSAISAEIDNAAADLAAGRLDPAINRITTVLRQHPNSPRALGMLGQIAVYANQPAYGIEPLQRAAALDPRLEHHIWLALCLAQLNCYPDALRVISVASQTAPPTADAQFAIGMVFFALGRFRDAARCYANCLRFDPTRADAHYRHARALLAAGGVELAIDAYREAIRYCSTDAAYFADLSAALSDAGRFEEARLAAGTALTLDPGCIIACNNLGHALLNLNRSSEAAVHYQAAIRACGTYAKAQFGYALALLKNGDFARGWAQYEWRWVTSQVPRAVLGVPFWRGQDIGGQTILLHAEQGFGDTIQFIRFAPLVASRGGRIVVEVPPPLMRLVRDVDGVAEVIACGDPVPPIDLHCPMASLPLAVQLRLESIPALPYLHGVVDRKMEIGPGGVPTRPTRHTSDRTGDRPHLVVGLVWAGEPRHSEPNANLVDRRRSTTLDVLSPLLDIEGTRFVSFQFGEARQQIAACERPIVDVMDDVVDFADTAARLAAVDLLVSVDTSIVHLAGGLGMPVWMLSRFDGCWRWLERRADTPWYPSMRIFRQPSPGDWSGLVNEVRTALCQEVRRFRAIV